MKLTFLSAVFDATAQVDTGEVFGCFFFLFVFFVRMQSALLYVIFPEAFQRF